MIPHARFSRSGLCSVALALVFGAGAVPAARGDGACCHSDGTCTVETATACTYTIRGIWKGENTACNTANCIKFDQASYIGGPVPIPDAPAPSVAGAPAFADIFVPPGPPLSFLSVSVFIPHPRQGDLRIALTHMETGTTVVLVDRPGFPQTPQGFTSPNFGASPGVWFEVIDLPWTQVYDFSPSMPSGMPNVMGEWRSEQPLATFNGENRGGLWRLWATDSQPGAAGAIMTAALKLGLPPCYANCDGSTLAPVLNVADFTCFLTRFAANDPYANCDGSQQPPVLNVADFTCFLTKFAAGCGPG